MAKRFCGNGLAWVKDATRFSSSVRTATADTATAALSAATRLAAGNVGRPTAGTNRVMKGASIIAIASRRTGAAGVKRHRA
jgi:hypothetical protein